MQARPIPAEKELQDYKQALDASALVAITDQKGIITYVNEKFCRVSKYRREELIGQDHRILNSGYHSKEYIRDLWRTIAYGEIWRGEFRNRAKDGSIYWVDATIVPFLNQQGKPYQYLAIRNEITERKLQEQRMRDLEAAMEEQRLNEHRRITRAAMQAEERERNRLGRELHDNVNQILVSTKLHLGMIQSDDPGTTETVKFAMRLLDKTISEIRGLSARQVAPLKNVNLRELIADLLFNIEANTRIKTEFLYRIGATEISDEKKLNIYRIVQEQLNNALKHAGASRIKVSMTARKGHLHIVVSDDGKGFNPVRKRKGIGIFNIITRVESFNGTFSIDSRPGAGCRLITKIPANA